MYWTPSDVELAKAKLRAARSFDEALRGLSDSLGQAISGDSLQKAFRRAGEQAPKYFLGRAAQPDNDIDIGPQALVVPADRVYVDREPEPQPKAPLPELQCWIVLPDCHIPFHSRPAWNVVMKIARALKPYGIATIGDLADFLSVSTHPRTPAQLRWQFKDEVTEVNACIDELDALGCTEKKFFCGNHENRGQRLALKQAIGLYDSMDPEYLFRLKERGWEYFPYQQHARIGKLNLVHDVGFCGKYAAWQNGAAFEASTIQGHTHHASLVYFGNAVGEHHVSATIGWLGDPAYAGYMAAVKTTRNWQHAFGLAYVETDTGNTHFKIVPIIEGRAEVNGQLFAA